MQHHTFVHILTHTRATQTRTHRCGVPFQHLPHCMNIKDHKPIVDRIKESFI